MDCTINRGMRILPESSWRPVFQRSIDAFYEGNMEEGIAACLTLLNEPSLPAEIRDLTFRNQTFYARPLDELIPGARWHTLPTAPGEGQPPDPSPASRGERLVVLLRVDAAETKVEAGEAPPPGGDAMLEPELVTFLHEPADGSLVSNVRPFFVNGTLHAAALFHEPGANKAVRAGVMRFGDEEWEHPLLLGPRAGQFRQGWSPLLTDAGPRFIAWWEPTEVFGLDAATRAFERLALRMAPHIAERFQGGSQGVPVPGGYLFLVNEATTLNDGAKITLCRFVRIDESFQITDVSPSFYLAARGTDVATGLARQGDRLIAGFTSEGTNALLATIDLEPLLATLIPVPAPGHNP